MGTRIEMVRNDSAQDLSVSRVCTAADAGVDKFDTLKAEDALAGLSACCRQTVRSHVVHNPMMVCPDCKLMIKCFADERSFNNYVTFCKSRGRRIKTVVDSGFYFVMYKNYPMSIGSG